MIRTHRAADQQGQSTVAVALLVLAVGSLVAAGLAELASSELVITQDRRTLATGLAAVDACLADVVAALPSGWSYTTVLLGPDGLTGTSDDGVVPAPAGCAAVLTPGPLGATRPFVDVAATVVGGRRRARAVLGRVSDPAPATLWVTQPATLGSSVTSLTLDGVDPLRPDVSPLPAVAGATDAVDLDAWLIANAVVVAGGTPPPVFHPAAPWDELAVGLTTAGASLVFAPTPLLPAPALHRIASDLIVATPGFGAGLLQIDGVLDIRADFTFSGIVAARGGVRVSGGSTFVVEGSLWIGPAALDVAGTARVRHDRAALDAVDALFPLPRRPRMAGLVDA